MGLQQWDVWPHLSASRSPADSLGCGRQVGTATKYRLMHPTTSPTRPLPHRATRWAGLLCALSLMVATGCGSTAHTLSGMVRQPLPAVDTVALPDLTGGDAPFAFRAPEGGLLLVYFGYTFCPDICPTTLSDVKAALERLGDDASRVEVAFVTVDPARDTAENLGGYIGFFAGEAGHALRTEDPVTLETAAEGFGASYEVTTNAEGEIEVGHSANLYVVDDQGRLLLTWPFGTSAEALTADLQYLLDSESTTEMQRKVTP